MMDKEYTNAARSWPGAHRAKSRGDTILTAVRIFHAEMKSARVKILLILSDWIDD